MYNIAMEKTVSSAYARSNFADILRAVEDGETVTITRHNKPIATVSPSKPAEKPVPKFGTLKGKAWIIDPHWADPMTEEEMDAFLDGRY